MARVLNKFTENQFEKLERLLELQGPQDLVQGRGRWNLIHCRPLFRLVTDFHLEVCTEA